MLVSKKSINKYPKISVVTPSYNQGEFLEATIKSVLDQKYPNLEYVVIDGGSSDNSKNIISKYENRLTYWHSKKDSGQADAINQGFARTTGEIMLWINSDDLLLRGSLRLVASIFSNFPSIDWVSSTPATVTSSGHLNYVSSPPYYYRPFIKNGLYVKKLLGFIMQEGTFWRRSLWEISGARVSRLTYSLDWDLWRRFAIHTRLIPIHAVLAAYRLNPKRKNNDLHKKRRLSNTAY